MSDQTRKRKRRYQVSLLLNGQEMNYIDGALRYRIAALEAGPQHGNIPYLLSYSCRLQKKLQRLHTAAQRKFAGEKKWKAHRRMVNEMIHKARGGSDE